MTSRHKHGLFFAAALMLGLVVVLQLGCQGLDPIGADGLTGGDEAPASNQPPITHLTLYPDEGARPDTTTSYKLMNWWADDPDGWVTGYQYRWGLIEEDSLGQPVDTAWYDGDFEFTDEEVWTHTEKESGEFILPIRTSSATFAFQVRAIDNYGAIDETGAEIAFPVINSPPVVDFRLSSNPTSLAGKPYYTFPVRSFVWDATDPDGNQTIASFFYAVDAQPDDTTWIEVDSRENSVTLEALTAGEHVFYLKARDLAGFDSPTILFPDTNSSSDPSRWVVKAPAAGGRLIVDDYYLDADNEHLKFYKAVYDSIYGTENDAYSVWELGTELPYVTADLTLTLGMFNEILWYSNYGTPLLTQAFNSMYTFINTPGNEMLLTTMVVDTGMVLGLAEIDTATIDGRHRVLATYSDDPVYFVPEDTLRYPEMQLRDTHGRELVAFVDSTIVGADIVYRFDESTRSTPQYEGTPVICIHRQGDAIQGDYTLMTTPLALVQDKFEAAEFLRAVFDYE